MTDRDQFAAAALTGLLANGDYGMESTLGLAWGLADAMLRERERTNHDAAPAATARTDADRGRNDKADVRPGEGTGDTRESLSGSLPADLGDGVSPSENDKNLHHTQDSFATYARFAGSVMEWIDAATDVFQEDKDGSAIVSAWYRCRDAYDRIVFPTAHDAAPAARVQTDADRVRTDKAASRPGAGTGDTQEPVAWGVQDDRGLQYALHPTPGHASHMARTASVGLGQVVPLYRHRQPTLTDAEREAVSFAYDMLCQRARELQAVHAMESSRRCVEASRALQKLFERGGGVK